MKNVLSPIMSFTIFVVSCSTPKEVVTNTNSTQDGLTFATAVVINEKNESKGVNAEYKWLREHYPGYKSEGQSLAWNKKTPYDVISIVLPDGKKLDVYFDISKFFGKF